MIHIFASDTCSRTRREARMRSWLHSVPRISLRKSPSDPPSPVGEEKVFQNAHIDPRIKEPRHREDPGGRQTDGRARVDPHL